MYGTGDRGGWIGDCLHVSVACYRIYLYHQTGSIENDKTHLLSFYKQHSPERIVSEDIETTGVQLQDLSHAIRLENCKNFPIDEG